MASKNKGLHFDGVLGSSLRDTQGEVLDIAGADISEMEMGKGILNVDHAANFYNLVGRITGAKKIFSEADCSSPRHQYYWDKIKAPYIYGEGYLFDADDHPHAKATAAILRNIHKTDSPLKMKASVEGGVLARDIKDPRILLRTKVRGAALTFVPANNATLIEPIGLTKSSYNEAADYALMNSIAHLAKSDIPSFRSITRHASASTIIENIHKIEEMSKSVGIDPSLIIPDIQELLNKAVSEKIQANILKIQELTNTLKKASKKQLKQMLGDADKDGEAANWISQNLKRDDLATWAARAYKKDPSILSEANKTALAHHASIADTFDSRLRLDKSHDFETGMKLLQEDGDALSKKHAENNRFVEPEGKKLIDLGGGKAWYSLEKGSCSTEAKAMGHCGNQPSEIEGDNILSLRQEHKDAKGNIKHKPLTTVIENGGYIGESKGPANEKPTDKEAMAALIRHPSIKGVIGGGYAHDKNFHLQDLSEEHQKELGHKFATFNESMNPVDESLVQNPRFGDQAAQHNTSVRALKVLKENPNAIEEMPKDIRHAIVHHAATDKNTIEKIMSNSYFVDDYISEVAAESSKNKHLFDHFFNHEDGNMRQMATFSPMFGKEHIDQGLSDEDPAVRAHVARRSDLTKEQFEKAFNDEDPEVVANALRSPHVTEQHLDEISANPDIGILAAYSIVNSPKLNSKHVDNLLNSDNEYARQYAVESSVFGPEHMDKAMNDPYHQIRYTATMSPHFEEKHFDKAFNDESEHVRQAAVSSPHFKPEHMEQALKDKHEFVRLNAVNSEHFGPEHMSTAMKTGDQDVISVAQNKAKSWNLNKARPNPVTHGYYQINDSDAAYTGSDAHKAQINVVKKLSDRNIFPKAPYKTMINEDTGKPELHIAVHRGIEKLDPDANGPNKFKVSDTHIESSHPTVHTLHYTAADEYTGRDGNGQIISSWIPVSKINALAEYHDGGFKDKRNKIPESMRTEHIMVAPNKKKKGPIDMGNGWTAHAKIIPENEARASLADDPHSSSQKHISIKPGKYRRLSSDEIAKHSDIEDLDKSLTAGYGLAGKPSDLSGGGVLQTQHIPMGRGISYMKCDQCGDDQVYMPRQTRCRHCKVSIPFDKLARFMLKNT